MKPETFYQTIAEVNVSQIQSFLKNKSLRQIFHFQKGCDSLRSSKCLSTFILASILEPFFPLFNQILYLKKNLNFLPLNELYNENCCF